MRRSRRGERSTRIAASGEVRFQYVGLDGVRRQTRVGFWPIPAELSVNVASYAVKLRAGERSTIIVTTTCEEEPGRDPPSFFAAYRGSRRAIRAASCGIATV